MDNFNLDESMDLAEAYVGPMVDRKIREMPAKKVSRVIDVQKNNQLKYSFTGVPHTDPRACFNRSTWSPAVSMQQPPLGKSNLILGDSWSECSKN